MSGGFGRRKRRKRGCSMSRKAFTILEIIITIVFVVIVTAPILNTFQLSERLSEKSRRGFVAQNLAREMMAEISKKSFSDPDGMDTWEAGLLPGPTHEEYSAGADGGRIANGTDEVSGAPRLMNETLIDRARFYDDIDDYDGYNSDETILPTDASGREFIYGGRNAFENFRVKVRVSSDADFSGIPSPLLATSEVIGAASLVMASTRDSKYLLLTDPATNLTEIYNTSSATRLDNQPDFIAPYAYGDGVNTDGSDPVSLTDLRDTPFEYDVEGEPLSHIYKLGPAAKTIIGPAGDRFYTLHRAPIADSVYYSAVSTIDMNERNTPEVSFHKLDDINLVARDLRSNSINAVIVDGKFNVYAATNGAGLMKSDDNGDTWSRVVFCKTDGVTPVTRVNCLAANSYSERLLNRSVVLAGADGGLLVIENNSKKTYRDASIGDSQNVTALAMAENGYTAAGLDDGSIYVSSCFALEYGKNHSSLTRKRGPVAKKINALAIDDNYRLWLGCESGQYYSDDAFLNLSNDACTWSAFTSENGINALYIDRSRTMPAPFIDVPLREAPGIVCSPSLLADDNGLHLFYLDDSTDGGNGVSLANTKLWYVRSADFGKSWNAPVRICHTPNGNSAWAHSETIDRAGVIHAMWQSKINRNEWNVFYQRSEDGGKKWLADDRCAFNQFGEKPLHSYNYRSGAEKEWVKFGSGKLSRIGASANGTLYCVASSNDLYTYHYSFLSPSGGLNWNGDYVMSVFKPTEMPVGYVESINVLSDKNKMFNVATIGENYSGRIFFEAELYAREARINVNSLNLFGVADSAPPAFNDALTMLYCFTQFDQSGEISLNSLIGYYPYTSMVNTKLEVSADTVYQPQLYRSDAYLFFAMKPDPSIDASSGATGRVFMARSSDCGNNYSPPIFIDYLYGTYDQLASAQYRSKIYMLKKNAGKSPASGFALSSVPSQLMFCGTDASALSFDCEMAPVSAADAYPLGARVNAFAGDDEGNMLCATSDGLYVRSLRKPGVVIDYPAFGQSYQKGFVSFPPAMGSRETFSDPSGRRPGWQKFFDGLHITSVHAEKGGIYWAATLRNGLYRSNDYGASWKHIEARLSNIVDISRVERGKAAELNRLNLVTRRFNAGDGPGRTVIETLFVIYDLATASIKSCSVLASEPVDDPAAAESGVVCSAAASADGSRIFFYDPASSSIYYKKPDVQRKNSFQLFKVYTLHEEFNRLDVDADAGDELTVCLGGRLKAEDCRQSFLASPITFLSAARGNSLINDFELKLGEEIIPIGQYRSVTAGLPAAPFIRLKPFIDVSAAGAESSYVSEANFFADVELRRRRVPLNISPIRGVTSLACGPDGDTLYAVCRPQGKVYLISGIGSMNDLRVTEYSRNLNEPSGLLFSPLHSDGPVKAFVVCRDNICELKGDPLISSRAAFEIAGSAMTDNNDLLFYDSASRRVYKCPRSSEKTVTVSVVDASPGSLISTPPVVIAKKFYSRDYGSINSSSRKYIRYNYIYTSRDYPNGIPRGSSYRWKITSDTDESVINVFVVDSLFDVAGEFYLETGMTIKFATADKKLYTDNFSGRSPASLRHTGERLVISGDVNDNVYFTSIDDPAAAPSIYNAPDGEYRSETGLPNVQTRMSHYAPPVYNQIGGARYGDWGLSDGSVNGSYGGLVVAGGTTNSFMFNHAVPRYGLLYGRNIYNYSLAPFNINDYETEWKKTNVYVIDGGSSFTLKNAGAFKIEQGTLVKIDSASFFIVEGKHDQIFPHCTFVSDGSPYSPVVFSPLGTAGSKEGRTPTAAITSAAPLLWEDWYRMTLEGTPEVMTFRKTQIKSVGDLNLSGTDASFNGCDISGLVVTTGKTTSIDIGGRSGGSFNNGQFSIFYPSDITTTAMSSVRFVKNDFNFTYNNNQGTPDQAFFYCEQFSTTIFKSNNFYDGYLAASSRTNRFNGTKFLVTSDACFDDNFFINSDQPSPPEGGSSCEISLKSINFEDGFSYPAWAEIKGNYFLNSLLPVYIEGLTETRALKNKIAGNYFINPARLAESKNSTRIASALSLAADPQKAAVDYEGFLYIVDKKAGAYYKFNRNGDIMMRVSASGRGNGELNSPAALAVNATGEVYVADNGNRRIQKFDRFGNFILKFGEFGDGEGMLKDPSAIAVATVNNSEVVLITDRGRDMILKFTNEGRFIEELSGGLNAPADMAISADQKFAFIADSANDRIVKVQLNAGAGRTESFSVDAESYSSSSPETSGFSTGTSCAEGEYIQVVLTARNSDGSVNIDYKPRGGGSVAVESAGGAIAWEGRGIEDSSPLASDNGASFNENAFFRGVATFYARCAEPAGSVRLTARDGLNPKVTASASAEWKPETVPWGLVPDGINASGFKRYRALRDPSVRFIKIPGSNFERGDEKQTGGFSEIKMSSYYIAEAPVTNAQFNRWRTFSPAPPPLSGPWSWRDETPGFGGRACDYPDHPAVGVTYDDAKNYSFWLLRGENTSQTDAFLPSEAQYEKAMRGAGLAGCGNTVMEKIYPWGASFGAGMANGRSDTTADERPLEGGAGTTPIQKYPPQGYFGLYDISGNVYCWCRDWFSPQYQGTRIDPVNSIVSDYKVIRGGSWKMDGDTSFRCSARKYAMPSLGFNDVGFRPCLTPGK